MSFFYMFYQVLTIYISPILRFLLCTVIVNMLQTRQPNTHGNNQGLSCETRGSLAILPILGHVTLITLLIQMNFIKIPSLIAIWILETPLIQKHVQLFESPSFFKLVTCAFVLQSKYLSRLSNNYLGCKSYHFAMSCTCT